MANPDIYRPYITLLPLLFDKKAPLRGEQYLRGELRDRHFDVSPPPTTAPVPPRPASRLKGNQRKSSRAEAKAAVDSMAQQAPGPRVPTVQDEPEQRDFWAALKMAAEEDIERWAKIRAAMAKGFCRVIARVDVEAVPGASPTKRGFPAGLKGAKGFDEEGAPIPTKKRYSGGSSGGGGDGSGLTPCPIKKPGLTQRELKVRAARGLGLGLGAAPPGDGSETRSVFQPGP